MDIAMRTLMAPALVLALAGGCKAEQAASDYVARARKSEALVNLHKIATHAQAHYADEAASMQAGSPAQPRFPTEAAPLTPAVDCCKQNAEGKRKCEPKADDWRLPAWRALDFYLDRPFWFRYSYEPVDGGAGFVVRAVGDLDCDGVAVTIEARGSVVNGAPKLEIIEPPPSAD